MPLYIDYPSWLSPQIFSGVEFLSLFRWYGLMYVFAFVTAFLVFKKQVKEGALNTPNHIVTDDDVFSFFTFSIVFLLIGARLFSVLIYDTSTKYATKPWLIFWPWDENWNFTGLMGMSYHGGFVGGFLGMMIWCKRHKQPVFKWIDAMGISIPLGFTFGRIGNFLNGGELYGRITTMPWGVVFPRAPLFSRAIPWVDEFAKAAGLPDGTGLVNLPRHPSQLYEAFFEGIFLFVIFWLLRKKKPFDGFFITMYSAGYGLVRFIIEYFREPDADLGYRIAVDKDAPLYLNQSLLNLSTGQILCLIMIIGGLAFFAVMMIRKKKLAGVDAQATSAKVAHDAQVAPKPKRKKN